jgi:hypothetical protein
MIGEEGCLTCMNFGREDIFPLEISPHLLYSWENRLGYTKRQDVKIRHNKTEGGTEDV